MVTYTHRKKPLVGRPRQVPTTLLNWRTVVKTKHVYQRGCIGHAFVATLGRSMSEIGMCTLTMLLPNVQGETIKHGFGSEELAKEFAENYVREWIKAADLAPKPTLDPELLISVPRAIG